MSRVSKALFPSSSHQPPSSPQIANTTVEEIVSTDAPSPTTNISLIHDYIHEGLSSSPATTISQRVSSSAQALLESLLSNTTTTTNTTRALPLSVQGREEQIAESSYSHFLSSNTSAVVDGRSGNGTLDVSGGNVTTTILPVPDTTTLSLIHSPLPSPSTFHLSSSPSHIINSTSSRIYNMSAYPIPPPPPIGDEGEGRGKSSHFDWLNDIDISFADVTSFLASTGMIFGAVLPYVPQYLEIRKTKNSSGFSTYVCLALITANVLRIIFWFGKRFEIPLLIQSIVMIAAMFIMMEICLRMRNGRTSQTSSSSKSKTFLDLRLADFWQWTDLMSYIECTCAFTVVMGFLMYLFVDCPIFVESIGYTSLMMEACLALPQLIKNFNSKSTVGMSYMMVLLWAGGDLFKTGYFIIKQTPAQFIMCGVIQVTIDMLIMGQVAIYKSTPGDSSPSEKEAKL